MTTTVTSPPVTAQDAATARLLTAIRDFLTVPRSASRDAERDHLADRARMLRAVLGEAAKNPGLAPVTTPNTLASLAAAYPAAYATADALAGIGGAA